MKCYILRLNDQELPLESDLDRVVQVALGTHNGWSNLVKPLTDGLTFNNNKEQTYTIRPGYAQYFIGGRESLDKELKALPNKYLETTCGSGLILAIRSNIKVRRDGVRVKAFLRSKLNFYSGDESSKVRKKDYDDIRRKTLTVICVYNADRNGLDAPVAPMESRLLQSRLTFPDVASQFGQMRVNTILKKQDDRLGAYDNLVTGLNLD